jgi:hypothetical protein
VVEGEVANSTAGADRCGYSCGHALRDKQNGKVPNEAMMKKSPTELLKKADPLLRGILKEEEIKRLEGEEQFGKKLSIPIRDLVVQMGGVRTKKLKEFAGWLYELAALTRYFENTLSAYRKSVPALRQSKEHFHRALAHVRHSLAHLGQAEKLVRDEIAAGLNENLLNLRSPRSALLRLEKNIMKLEGMMAALIKPDLRTRKDEESVPDSPRKFEHLDLPAREKSKALELLVTTLLGNELKRFTEGKVSDAAIHEFISQFLDAIRLRVVASSVKTRLYRRRRAEEEQSEPPRGVTRKESVLKR